MMKRSVQHGGGTNNTGICTSFSVPSLALPGHGNGYGHGEEEEGWRSSISSMESFFSSPTSTKKTATPKEASLQSQSSLMMKWQNNHRNNDDIDDDSNSSTMMLETPPPPPRDLAPVAAGLPVNGMDYTGGDDATTLENQGRSVSSFEMPPMIPDW
jgi:hypothetical protein